MVFSSIIFVFFFLPAVLLCYYVCPKNLRNCVLLVFSLLFYSWGEPVYILIMLFSAAFDYANGLVIERLRHEKRPGAAKAVMINSVVINLGILGFFKYGNFIIDNLNAALNLSIDPLDVALPLGISFYTFQTLSYTIDVYRDRVQAQRNIVSFGVYVSMFPQLIAGPIVQYRDIGGQLSQRTESISAFSYGIKRFIIGLSKKALLANNIGLLWEQISAADILSLSAGTAWLGAVAFSFQIYFDFSGYSDMAIGLGSMFGFSFPENFNLPYRARSITEFWRRWHISLGAWFREYVYIPLGGNRKGPARLVLNLLIVWGLTGLWHGASWNFVLWGLFFGLLLIMEKLCPEKILCRIPDLLRHIFTLILVIFSWMIFAFEDLGQMTGYLKAMLGLNQQRFMSSELMYYISANLILLSACAVCSFSPQIPCRYYKLCRVPMYFLLFFLCICFLVGDTYNPFLYFRF